MKIVKKQLLVALSLLTVTFTFAQRGKDGNVTVNTVNRVVNEYTTLTANAAAGATTISVAASSLNANSRFTGSLAAGDLIMIIQMQGISVNASSVEFPAGSGQLYGFPNDNTLGDITAYNNCGNYEFAEVSSVPNGTSITLDCGLQHDYTSAGRVQIVRVPRYNTLTITAPGTIVCTAWATGGVFAGGVVAIEVLGNTIINNTSGISASLLGFRGGSLTGDNLSGLGGGQVARNNGNEGAEKGEGVYGYQADYNSIGGRYARAAVGNAGGGANCHNSGGGGGANGGSLAGWDGSGNPDVSGGGGWVAAWNLEGGSFSTHVSPGGGRGGYSFSSSNRDATTEGPQPFQTSTANSWGGDSRENNGGWGGRPLDYSTGRLFMGGGGGAGDQDNSVAGAGGKGGGLIYLMSYGTVSGTGTITANGGNGNNSGHDGAGGGGAGGTVIVNSVGTISGITINANGGNGGNQNIPITATMQAEGPGGSGGGGYIATSGGAVAQNVNPGANGTTDSNHLTEFPPNGATRGAVGTANQPATNFIIAGTGAAVCAGSSASISAALSGTVPAGTTILWYTAETGGTAIGSGSPFTTPVVSGTTTFYAGTCPGTYRIPVTVTVTPGPSVSVNSPAICAGETAGLIANGGTTYTWTTGATSTGVNTADASPSITTTYTVTGTTSGCSGTATATVTVTPLPAVTVDSPTICAGQTASLTANGGTTYTWTTGATPTGTNTANASPATTTSYTVTGTTGSCSNTAISTVTVTPLPAVSVNSPAICSGQTAGLIANGAAAYTWTTGATSTGVNTANASPTTTTTYTVTGTTNSCSSSAVATVTVTPSANATITNIGAVCAGAPAFNLTAANPGGTWSGTGITDAVNGTFTPSSTGGMGVYTVTYTISGTCGATDTALITVSATSDPTITQPANVCVNAAAFNLTAATAGGTWSGTGITNGSTGTFNPTTAGQGSHLITYTISGSCGAVDTAIINVTSLLNVTISAAAPACLGAAPFNLSAATTGGTWSGTGITDGTNGTFSPAASGVGTFTVTYTLSGSCGNTDTALVTITPNSDPTIVQPAGICVSASPVTLTAATAGGTWSGIGITDTLSGTFDPSIAGTGTQTITYTIGGACGGTDTVLITVNSTSNATITTPASVCAGTASFNLSAATAGGTWTGTGITNGSAGTFDPVTAGPGSHIVTYTLSGSCGASDTAIVTVNALPVIIVNSPTICAGQTANLSAGGGTSYTWTAGTTVTGTNTADASPASTDTYTVTGTVNGCSNTAVSTVTVTPLPTISVNSPTICAGQTANLTANGGTTYSWTAGTTVTGINTANANPGATTTYTVTGTTNGCSNTSVSTVTVHVLPTPNITSDLNSGCAPLCVQFTETVSTSCGSVSYGFGDGGVSTTSDPEHCFTTPGVYSIVITCTDANSCVGSTTITNMITVDATPTANMTISPAGAVQPNTVVTFTDASTGGGNQFWNFGDPLSGINNTSSLSEDTHVYTTEGEYCITLIASNTGGCTDTLERCIDVFSDAVIVVPNIFTPNGDGDNDDFFIVSTGVKELECTIYDRWGLKLAGWNAVNGGWDGRTTSGNDAPDGVYYYVLKATGYNEKVTEKQGFLQLLKN